MGEFTLYIGNKATSSWSLRGWLACKLARIDFEEITIPLDMPETRESILRVSPSGRVPCLHHGKRRIWETIAIGEYLAELNPERDLWPAEPAARAHARSIAAEMHSGFAALRAAMWMNVRKRFPGHGRTNDALADIARIVAIWRDTRAAFGAGGPYLFGRSFSFADAMYAPVATRFVTWAPELPHDAAAYVEAVWWHPWLKEWVADAVAEPWPTPKLDTPPAVQSAS